MPSCLKLPASGLREGARGYDSRNWSSILERSNKDAQPKSLEYPSQNGKHVPPTGGVVEWGYLPRVTSLAEAAQTAVDAGILQVPAPTESGTKDSIKQ